MSNKNYDSLKSHRGIYKHKRTGRYLSTKKIKGKKFSKTFDTISEARHWRNTFNGKKSSLNSETYSTLKDVWETMQLRHFPTLAESTRQIWIRRYTLLKELEDYPMNMITQSLISKWVSKQVEYFRSEIYEDCSRGGAKRCNLDNELNLFTTIFNWYKQSDEYEYEAVPLTNPVKIKHKRMGFIRAKPIKDKAITLEHARTFFSYLKPLYRDLALLQFYTASRIGEAAGLQWERVDFENKRITIMETCFWDMQSKAFVHLNKHPKNKEPRPVYMTKELEQILRRRKSFREEGCNFVFHVGGLPLNYGTIQVNYREAQRKGNIPYSGTHILRHGMAKLARKVGGGLDAVIAMTGHKDLKLADHYSKLDTEFQKEVSEKIMDHINENTKEEEVFENNNMLEMKLFKNK